MHRQSIFSRPGSWAVLFVVALIAGPVWIVYSRPEAIVIPPAPRAGAPAPDFEFQTLDGDTILLSELQGQAVVLNLWATWCPPCRAEMPSLQRIGERYAGDGLVIVALNQGEDAATVSAFVQEHGLTFIVGMDSTEQVGRMYELQAYPTTFFIGRDGVIRDVVQGGPMSEALIEDQVRRLVD